MTRAVAKPAEPAKENKPKQAKPARPPRELREVLASPGHPLDPSLRRELESRLGHDFGRVRVHNDSDAAAVTELLGADAVTVGQDIFFGQALFRPETTDGRRLLVHELLHTVQVPDARGAVWAGRDSGAVSLPSEPLEREAEQIARSDEPRTEVSQGQGAAWMRYATVDADRMRTEQLDPATLVDRLVAGVLRSLRGDPGDLSGRVRGQLSRFTPELRHTVLVKLELRLPSPEFTQLVKLVEEADQAAAGGPVETPAVPEPVPEPEPEPPVQEKPEPEAPAKEPEEEKPPAEKKPESEEPKPEEEKPKEEEKEEPEEEKPSDEKPAEERPAEEQVSAEPAAEAPAAMAPGAPGAMPAAGQGPAAGATPMPAEAMATAEPAPAQPEKVEAEATAPESPLVQHGVDRPEQDERVEEQERPIGVEPAADQEVELPEPEEPKTEDDEPERPALKPEDSLPQSDLDVSAVPTAENLTLPASGSPPPPQQAPSFPAPPPTKAEQVEEESPDETPAVPEPVEAEEPPAEQPLDAEVGPDPATAPAATPAPIEPEPVEQEAPEPVQPEPAEAEAGPAEVPTAQDLAEVPGEAEPTANPAPEASLERDGGGCEGPPAPTTEPDAGGGGCGGGGAPAPAAEPAPKPAPPDVSAQPPESALATVSTLPPDQMASSLSSVDSAVSHDVGEKQSALQAAPPTMQRPSGAPQTLDGQPTAEPAGEFEKVTLTQAEAQRAEQQEKLKQEQVQGQNQASQAPRPHVAGNAEGQISAEEVKNVQQAVDNVPTTDPGLQAKVEGQHVELTGEQDPARTDQQATELRDASTKYHTTGQREAAKPLGENQIFPNAPAQTLSAQVPSAPGGGPAAAQAGPSDPGVAVVAQQERGPQIQAGVAEGQTAMGTERQTQQQAEAKANADHEAEVTRTVQENSEAQAAERGKVAEDAAAKRAEWRSEQDKKITETDTKADEEHENAKTGIHKEKTDGDKKVDERQKEDNDKITHEREQAEEKARKEKEAKKKESEGGGFFSWLASKVTSFFEGLLNAITKIFDAAVALVNTIIKTFATIVTGLIDLARKAIVGLINALANVLLTLCDALAVFFPELAARIRNDIENLRDAAIATVNKLADALKAGVEFLLNKLAEALTGLLRLLEKGLKAAVEIVRKAVNAAIEFAKAAIQMLGEFAAIIADIASTGVGTWIGKLVSAATQGIREFLWGAIKSAVKTWFNEKVEAVLGLGKAVINILIKGCFSMAKIGKMAWDALIAALPMMIVTVVIERLVSLIIPAAGAVLAVIQGLMAAWGTISKILAAIGAFIAFVKAVKAGPAACLFAKAVAAGVVALLEFITNFLMAKLASAAKGVGKSLKGIAQKIMKALARAGKGARKGAGKMINAARTGLKKVGQALKPKGARTRPGRPARPGRPGRPARPGRPGRSGKPARPGAKGVLGQAKAAVRKGVDKVKSTLKKIGKKVADSKLGKGLKNAAKKARDKYRGLKNKWKAKAKQRQEKKQKKRDEQNSPQAKERRLQLAIAKIRPKVHFLLRRGVSKSVLTKALGAMRRWYHLTSLQLKGGSNTKPIRATLNPEDDVSDTEVLRGVEIVSKVEQRVNQVLSRRKAREGQKEDPPGVRRDAQGRAVVAAQEGTPPVGITQQVAEAKKARTAAQRVVLQDSPVELAIWNKRGDRGGIWSPVDPLSGKVQQGKGRYSDLFNQVANEIGHDRFQELTKLIHQGRFKELPKGSDAATVAALFTLVRMTAEGQRRPAAVFTSEGEIRRIIKPGAGVPQIMRDISVQGPMVKDASTLASTRLSRSMKGLLASEDPDERIRAVMRRRAGMAGLSPAQYEQARTTWNRPDLAGLSDQELSKRLETPVGLLQKLTRAIEQTLEDEQLFEPGKSQAFASKFITDQVDILLVRWGWLTVEDLTKR
ncbi:DUF4157 domain-containing protein [Amycolatopsis sp. NPDC059657]|uniref:eCIS core domain-containing protein n=1 Tax=Amycolatopsis sp. NPDC059657 TaxID=3346899 RepID=UPI00367030C4